MSSTMSLFARYARRVPPRRAYSFFSSKPGGGRYFNSAKPPKIAGKTKVEAKTSSAPSATSSPTPAQASGSSALSVGHALVSAQAPGPSARQDGEAQEEPTVASSPESHRRLEHASPHIPPHHPSLSAHDFKLHQFFALHRPLLLHSLPSAALFDSPSPNLITHTQTEAASLSETTLLDNPPESSQESDADAARQLVRAMVLNRVGAQVEWEKALTKLGLDEPHHDRMQAALQGLKGVMVDMDSTKRKKRKKMNKHRYKKRRRATRAQRRKLDK